MVLLIYFYYYKKYCCATIHDEYIVPYQFALIFKDLINCVVRIDQTKQINFTDYNDIYSLIKNSNILVDKRLQNTYNFFIIL